MTHQSSVPMQENYSKTKGTGSGKIISRFVLEKYLMHEKVSQYRCLGLLKELNTKTADRPHGERSEKCRTLFRQDHQPNKVFRKEPGVFLEPQVLE